MIKGTQRKIIMLKDTKSGIFDEAYFILKNSGIDSSLSRSDMVKEADRIISDSTLSYSPIKKNKRKKKVFYFLLFTFGALFGAMLSVLISNLIF